MWLIQLHFQIAVGNSKLLLLDRSSTGVIEHVVAPGPCSSRLSFVPLTTRTAVKMFCDACLMHPAAQIVALAFSKIGKERQF